MNTSNWLLLRNDQHLESNSPCIANETSFFQGLSIQCMIISPYISTINASTSHVFPMQHGPYFDQFFLIKLLVQMARFSAIWTLFDNFWCRNSSNQPLDDQLRMYSPCSTDLPSTHNEITAINLCKWYDSLLQSGHFRTLSHTFLQLPSSVMIKTLFATHVLSACLTIPPCPINEINDFSTRDK